MSKTKSSRAAAPPSKVGTTWKKCELGKDWEDAVEKMLATLVRRHGGGLDYLCGRLVAEFGTDRICAAIGLLITNPRGRGRPSKNPFKRFEDIYFTQWIYEQAALYRAAGKTNPLQLSILDAFELEYGNDSKNPTEEKYETIAKDRLKNGKREIRHLGLDGIIVLKKRTKM